MFHQNVPFPLKNVPVVSLTDISRETIRRELGKQEDSAILAFPGINSPENNYQLAFVTPGIRPFEAISRNWIRLMPNRRM